MPEPSVPGPDVQATVERHDLTGGTVLLDDDSRLDYPAAAVAPQVRVLHPGQRVRLRVEGEPPRVATLTLVGLALPT